MSQSRATKNRRPRRRRKNRALKALLGAALALPGLGGVITQKAVAQNSTQPAEIRLGYSYYKDYQKSGDRMRVDEPMLWARTPLGEKTEVEGGLTLDTMSGASPLYLSSLSGASGLGIDDIRRAADAKVTHYFDGFSLTGGFAMSSEQDYLSHALSIGSSIWSADKNTTLTIGMSHDIDHIGSTQTELVNESRRSFDFLVGITQVLTPDSIFQSNLEYDTGDGYFTDPYKALDYRPNSREQWAWLNRYNLYFEGLDGSLHTDYRLTHDTWGITSNMVEVAWYQPFGGWMIIPDIRYYTQTQARFFSDTYPPPDYERFYSADQRTAAFGEVVTGIKVVRELVAGFAISFRFDYLQQRKALTVGTHGSNNIEPFYARMFSIGLVKRF